MKDKKDILRHKLQFDLQGRLLSENVRNNILAAMEEYAKAYHREQMKKYSKLEVVYDEGKHFINWNESHEFDFQFDHEVLKITVNKKQ